MATTIVQQTDRRAWRLVRAQHGVVGRRQLLGLGLSDAAIRHRLETGRLHPLWPGVYVVGRPDISEEGRWMGAVLACGDNAGLGFATAAALLGFADGRAGQTIHVVTPAGTRRRLKGISLHRKTPLFPLMSHRGIPVTAPIDTLVDLASVWSAGPLEDAVRKADVAGLVDLGELREAADVPRRRGARAMREMLDRRTLSLTDSVLERRFLPIVRRAGLPEPERQVWIDGSRVDFWWPDLNLVVETDGLTYHRTPTQQAEDRRRDQAHTAAGRTTLRFTHAQVTYEPAHVERTLQATAARRGDS